MNERTRALRDVQRTLDATTDPAALAAYAAGFRPVVAKLRDLAEDATLPTGTRVRSRKYSCGDRTTARCHTSSDGSWARRLLGNWKGSRTNQA